MGFGDLLVQARRRRVFRTAGLYVVGAWLLLQIAALAFPALSIPDGSIRFVWIAAILGFPVAIAFGWRYDIQGGRIVRTSDRDESAPLSLQQPDYLILGALGIVAIVIVAGSLSEISDTQESAAPSSSIARIDRASIAVLPFVAVTAQSDDQYLADGISEVLIHQLSNVVHVQRSEYRCAPYRPAARRCRCPYRQRATLQGQVANHGPAHRYPKRNALLVGGIQSTGRRHIRDPGRNRHACC
mgnify:CR=1 FL=1